VTVYEIEVWDRGRRVATCKMAGTPSAIRSQMRAIYGASVTVTLTEVKRA